MIPRLEHFQRRPLLILGALWPLVLLAPHMPGIPRPIVPGLPWRQELTLVFLLSFTIVFLVRKKIQVQEHAGIDRNAFVTLAFGALFVGWIWLSIAWATDHYQSLHLAMQWSCYLVFFVLIISAPAKVIRSSFVGLAIVIWILAFASTIEFWFGGPLTDASLRIGVKPLLRGSGNFGEIMGAACILFAGFAFHLRRSGPALVCGATAVAAWFATLHSLERAPFIGVCAGLFMLCTGAFLKPSRRQFRRLVLLGVAFAFAFTLQAMPSRLTNHDVPIIGRLQQSLDRDVNTQARLLLWKVGFEMARAHPLIGVGGNNYQIQYSEGRAQLSARDPQNPLVRVNDHLLPTYAHNEYVQILAELGMIGLLLFVLFSLALVATLIRTIIAKGLSLPVLGAGGAMLAFAISSGASASSFRYLSGGLMFFFAAALIGRSANFSKRVLNDSKKVIHFDQLTLRRIGLTLCAMMALGAILFTAQAAGITLQALGETNSNPRDGERYYRASLQVYPANTAAQFSYGMWLYRSGRAAEALPYLRSALEKGFNSSICYVYLAGAEEAAGDLSSAERTLASAVQVYPASVFLLVRHAAALARNGKDIASKEVFAKALSVDSRAARGWQELIDNDIDAAYLAAKRDSNIALPGELSPEAAVIEVLQQNEQRFPAAINSGWRARMRVPPSR